MSELKLQQCRLDGRYDVLECLGRGSYSEVYVARDAAAQEGAPRTVVIKALNTHLQGVPDAELERTLIENFRNEVEYLSGGDLQALVRNRPLPLEGALFYLEQVCAGLAYAHKHDVIHRDIKPQNLLLTSDQHTVKIADFGVAKIEAAEGAITRVGTEIYAAPEHHPLAVTGPLDTSSLTRRVVQLTPAADIYSLAKTTYMLLTGEAPRRFSRRPVTELPAEFAAQEWSSYVLRVLERATQTNPERRQQTVEEFWREIKDATLARTRPLRKDEGGASSNGRTPSDSDANRGAASGAAPLSEAGAVVPSSRGLATPPPPAPTFDREARARDTSGRHRIVVPISGKAAAAREMFTPDAGGPVSEPHARDISGPRRNQADAGRQSAPPPQPAYPSEREPRLSSAAKRWLVALALLLAFSGMLYATYRYVNNMRGAQSGGQQQAQQGGGSSRGNAQTGDLRVATTDVKLREGPGTNYEQVGLAEGGSRVKILQTSGKWWKVQVVEHARPKSDPDSEDEGWVNSTLLRTQ
jgi:serine/threonine protein kinase